MPMATKKPRLRSGFTLGGQQAEADPLLEDAFFESSDFGIIESHDDPRCFIVGRTGSGKSAVLQHLEDIHPEHVIRINPEDLSLPYITDLGVIKHLDELDVNLDLFWIALWKHILLVEIIRHRYHVNSPQAKNSMMEALREKVMRDPGKRAALQYLDDFDGRFWCETVDRVRDITDKFTERIEKSSSVGIKTPAAPIKATASAGSGVESSREERSQQIDRFQRVVNQTQLAHLNKMREVLNDYVLDRQHFTYIVIDDLDRDWVDERLANDLIRCLFRSVLDLQRVTNLKILVALRTNIFQELDFGRRMGGQEEKFRSLVLNVRWTKPDLKRMLTARVKVQSDRDGLGIETIESLFPNSNRTRGNPLDYIFDRTLLRPRDAIAFVNECLQRAVGKTRLTWDDITNAEAAYSSERLLALRDEWKPTFPDIDRIFGVFKSVPMKMDRELFAKRLDEAMLLLSDPRFEGVRWLTDYSRRMWEPGEATWFEVYQPLANLLYTIGFIGCATQSNAAPVFYADDPILMTSERQVEAAKFFFVHRTYHAGLGVRQGREPDSA